MSDPAVLLTESRTAHDTYRHLAKRPPKPAGWQSHLWDAYHLRLAAHELDPEHKDPIWSADKVSHEEMMAFYRTQLGISG